MNCGPCSASTTSSGMRATYGINHTRSRHNLFEVDGLVCEVTQGSSQARNPGLCCRIPLGFLARITVLRARKATRRRAHPGAAARIVAMGKQQTPPPAERKYEQLRRQLARLGADQPGVCPGPNRSQGRRCRLSVDSQSGRQDGHRFAHLRAICQDERSGGQLSPVAPPTQKNGESLSRDDLQITPAPTSPQELDPKKF